MDPRPGAKHQKDFLGTTFDNLFGPDDPDYGPSSSTSESFPEELYHFFTPRSDPYDLRGPYGQPRRGSRNRRRQRQGQRRPHNPTPTENEQLYGLYQRQRENLERYRRRIIRLSNQTEAADRQLQGFRPQPPPGQMQGPITGTLPTWAEFDEWLASGEGFKPWKLGKEKYQQGPFKKRPGRSPTPPPESSGDDDDPDHIPWSKLNDAKVPTGVMVLPELKWKDDITNVNITQSFAFTLLNGIAQGATQSTRLGTIVHIKKIQLNGHFFFQEASSTVGLFSQMIFYAVVLDKQSNGAAPTAAQIWNLSGGTNLQRNPTHSKRFTVLMSRRFPVLPRSDSLPGAGTVISHSFYRPFSWYHKPKNLTVHYTGTGSTISDISKNALWMVTLSDTTNINPFIRLFARMRYTG